MNRAPDGLDLSGGEFEDLALVDYLADVQERLRRNGLIEVETEASEHPQWADKLRKLLPVLVMMNEIQAADRPEGLAETTGVLGDFLIIKEIGRGGMGIVHEAVQVSLNRIVALKILNHVDTSDLVKLRRFQIEAQAAAGLAHPHIVPIFTIGNEGAVHYYAMRLIRGRTLAERISSAKKTGERLDFREAAKLARQAADALHFAHELGIIHRDVKPSNLLIEPSGWLWVADFGLARLPGEGDLTKSGVLLGTLRYTSPEQALGKRGLDARTDVYALGATLYEMLTLRPAISGDGRVELLREIKEVEPRLPRRIDPSIPVDLETIAMKAMAKEPGERYSTAKEFSEDLTRYLEDRPIVARPPGLIGTATRWCRRHKPMVAAAALCLFVSILALSGAIFWRDVSLRENNLILEDALHRAEANANETLRLRYGAEIRLAQQEADAGQAEFAQHVLERWRPGPKEIDLRGFEWRYLRRFCHQDVSILFGHQASVYALAVSPDAHTLVSGDQEGVMIFWDLDTWRERARVLQPGRSVYAVAFSPNGEMVASLSELRWQGGACDIKVWDPKTGRQVFSIPTDNQNVRSLSFSCDGRALILCGEEGEGAELRKNVELWRFREDGSLLSNEPIRIDGDAICVSRSQRHLATADDKGVVIRDAKTGLERCVLQRRFSKVSELAFTPGDELLAVRDGEKLTLWELKHGLERGNIDLSTKSPAAFTFHRGQGGSFPIRQGTASWVPDPSDPSRPLLLDEVRGRPMVFEFSTDGKFVAGVGERTPATLWDTSNGKKHADFPVKMYNAHAVAFTPDGQSLIFAGEDSRIRFWHFNRPPDPIDHVKGHTREVWSLAYSPRGDELYSAADDHTIKVWDTRDGHLKSCLRGHGSLVTSLAVSRDGKTMVSGGFDRTARLWNLPDGTPRAVLKGHTDRVRTVGISPDGRRIATGSSDATLRLWDASTFRQEVIYRGNLAAVRSLAFHPGGRFLASGGDDRSLRILDAETLRELRPPISCPWGISTIAFSPNGKTFATGDEGGNVAIWDSDTCARLIQFWVSDATIWSLSYSPDGRSLAAGCGDAKVRIVAPQSGQVLLVLNGHAERVNAVTFAPNGDCLASASHDGSISLWNTCQPAPGASVDWQTGP